MTDGACHALSPWPQKLSGFRQFSWVDRRSPPIRRGRKVAVLFDDQFLW